MTDAKEATHTEPDDIDKITAGVASLTTDSSPAAPVHSATNAAAPTVCNDPSIVSPIPGQKEESHPPQDLDRIKDSESINTHNQAPVSVDRPHPQPNIQPSDTETTCCIGITRAGWPCTFPRQENEGVLCWHHRLQKRGHLVRTRREKSNKPLLPTFTRRGELPSTDVKVPIFDEAEPRVIFPGWRFEMLTLGYDAEIKAGIRETIEEYFRFIGQTKAKARKEFIQGYEGYPDSMEWDFNTKYRDHLARGYIYLLTLTLREDQYERMGHEDRLQCEKGVLIKIGYTTDIKKRVGHYQDDCKLGSIFITTFPWIDPITGKGSRGLGLIHLLEKILHQIWTFEQRDVPCICGNIKNNNTSVVNMTCHTEIFAFEREEEETFKEAFNENLKLMEPHIMKWMDAIESLEGLYQYILYFQEKN